jgi:hypothetical protein
LPMTDRFHGNSMILVDTNVFSEVIKPVPDPKVVDWLYERRTKLCYPHWLRPKSTSAFAQHRGQLNAAC